VKGVVLAGGRGTRLRPITFAMAKQLVPIANRPIIAYGIEDLVTAGIGDLAVVVSPETGPDVRRVLGTGSGFGARITYVEQEAPLGLAHALSVALPIVGDDDVLMYLGDNLLKGGVTDVVADFETHRPDAQILLQKVADPSAFGVAELDASGRVVKLEEKPARPASDLVLVGVYLFSAGIEDALDELEPSARGEYEITDAIQWLIDHGRSVRSTKVSGWWKDTGTKEDLLHANELVLSDLVPTIGSELHGCAVSGPVAIGRRCTVVDSELVGPLVVGDDTTIVGSTLRAGTAVGDRCRVESASIERSILMDGSAVSGWSLRDSIVGVDAFVVGPAPDEPISLSLGERSEIGRR